MVSHQAATPWKRMVAAIIDYIVAAIPASIIGIPLGLMNSNLGALVQALIALAIFGLRDAMPIPALQGASIGKKVLGLKALRSDGAPCDFESSFKRNIPLMVGSITAAFAALVGFVGIPIIGLIISVLGGLVSFVVLIVETVKIFKDERGLRIGDLFASTYVYEEGAPVTSTSYDAPPPPPSTDQAPPPPPPA